MKKSSLIFACLIALSSFIAIATNTSDYVIDVGILIGDVNLDEHVNSADITALYDYLLNGNATNLKNGDVNDDGHINSADITSVYDILLNGGGGHIGGSELYMLDFINNSASSYNPDYYRHQWVDGDVIYLAIDADHQSTCQNVYAIERTGGKWVFRDVHGSSKVGFKTEGGTVDAVYVQNGNIADSYYDYIPIYRDVACVNHAGTYTVAAKDNKFYITLNDLYFYHFVSRIDVNRAYEGDYFYGSVKHLDALTKISWMSTYNYSAFETSSRAPVIDIDSSHKGHAYGVWEMGSRVNGWLTLNYAKSNGYAYYWNYGQDNLSQGKYLALVYSPWQNTWPRDLSMCGYNYDTKESIRMNVGENDKNITINVGTSLILRAYDGDNTDTQGQILSVTSSTSGILDVNISQPEQVSVVAHKMGTSTLTITHKTKDNITVTYTFNVTVEPTVWIAGKTSDNKPILWRNWEDKSMWLGGRDTYTSANEVIVRGDNAYVLLRKDVSGTYTNYYSGTAAIYKATGAHGGGYFNLYKDGLTGASKRYAQYGNYDYVIHYIAGIPHMWVDKNNNVYYTKAYRENYTNDYDCYVSTDIYKNKNLLRTNQAWIINDLVADDNGNLFFVGINSTINNDLYYIYLGHAIGYLAILTANNIISTYPWEHYLFNRLFVKDDAVYVDAYGFYKQDSEYETYYWSFGENVFLKYTASTGLQIYTGSVSENGLTMGGSNYNTTGTLVNPGAFLLEENKFYYSSPIKTYQLGASETASYTAYPSNDTPLLFDVKNGWIGMVLNSGTSSPLKVMTSELNAYNSGKTMENSIGATIYDVFMQTSLDD
jgi:hypothetical protein